MFSIDSTLHPSIRELQTPKEIWDSLKQKFEDPGIVRKMRLVREFHRTRLEDCESADAYVAKLTNVVAKLDEVGLNVPDAWQVTVMLYGLPPS